jgi:transposase InsO family protein
VERLMRINGIHSKRRRKFKLTTHSRHKRPVASNLIKRDFTAPKPNRLWTSDITYIRTQEGWLYLAVFLDVCHQRFQTSLVASPTTAWADRAFRSRQPIL